MKYSYYSLPLRLGQVIKKKELSRCNLEDSISDHIHLMITSHFNENKHDEEFGNSIWENEFSNISEDHNIREEIKRSVLRCISRHEPRLEQVQVNMRWLQEERGGRGIKRLSKRLDITITGTITVNRKPFNHEEQFYIAPLSYK